MASAVTNTLENPRPAADAPDRRAGESRRPHQQWADFISENLCKFSIQTTPEVNFSITARARSENGFVIARFTTVAGRARLERTLTGIRADGRCGYTVYAPLRGQHETEQFSRSAICSPGCVTLLSTGESYVHTKLGNNDTIYLWMPPAFVDQRLTHGEDICSRPASTRDGIGRLAFDAVAALQREAALLGAEEFSCAVRAAGELVLLAFAGVADLTSSAPSIRAGNLARAKRVIRARLHDGDLSLADIAGECGLSLRYLHDLFRDDGRTVREYLQGERLKTARSMLERCPAGASTVTDVGLACGFSTPSKFSTAFKRAFGLSPRDILRRI